MSIAKTILTQEPKSTFVLIYGNKTPKDTIFFNEILELHHNYLDRFNLQFVFSQSDEENALFGRIEKSTVNFIVKNKYKHIDIDDFVDTQFAEIACGDFDHGTQSAKFLNTKKMAESILSRSAETPGEP